MNRLGDFIEFSGKLAGIHRGGELPPLVSPWLMEMFHIDCGFFLYKSRYSGPRRPFIYHTFGTLAGARNELQQEMDCGQWFDNLDEEFPQELWLDETEFPEPLRMFMEKYHIRSASIWPIRFGDEIVGAVCLGRGYASAREDDVDVIRQCVLLISLVLNLVVHKRRAEFESYTDPLTGLQNRRGFEKAWDSWSQQLDMSGSIIIGMIDLDDLKMINDEQGHLAGDAVLLDVTKWLNVTWGKSAILCRWGGDEFVFAAYTTENPEKVSQAFEAESRLFRIKVSVGTAILGRDGVDLTDCLRVADERMYETKFARHS